MRRPGKLADFVVLDGSPLHAGEHSRPPAVLQTYVDGACVWGCS